MLLLALELCRRIAVVMASAPAYIWEAAELAPVLGPLTEEAATSKGPFPKREASWRLGEDQTAVCVVGQPRSFAGARLSAMALQLFESLCPLLKVPTGEATLELEGNPHVAVFFVLAVQEEPREGEAAQLQSQLAEVLAQVDCGRGRSSPTGEQLLSVRHVELLVDAAEQLPEEVAYGEDSWWHGEGGRRKWSRQLRALARCHAVLLTEEAAALERGGLPFGHVVLLRPDLLHISALPSKVQLGSPRQPVLSLPDSGQRLLPQAGYLEGIDRALIMSRQLAALVLLGPLDALHDRGFVRAHPHCLRCAGWRAPGAKLSPEKHLANVLRHAAAVEEADGFAGLLAPLSAASGLGCPDSLEATPGLDIQVNRQWLQPLVLTAEGCINARPGVAGPVAGAGPGPPLPRWARRLVVRYGCGGRGGTVGPRDGGAATAGSRGVASTAAAAAAWEEEGGDAQAHSHAAIAAA